MQEGRVLRAKQATSTRERGVFSNRGVNFLYITDGVHALASSLPINETIR